VVRFANGGREQTLTVVIGSGEQGRTISATFGAPPKPTAAVADGDAAKPRARVTTDQHPSGARILLIGGAATAAAGGAFGIFELTRVPSGCSISTHLCAASPGDKVFADAQSSMRLANIGWAVTGFGLSALAAGAIWYWKGATHESRERVVVTPWFSPDGGGLAAGGPL
jgi:hypothetical protein